MHANFASILGSIFERCWVHFGSENGAKMDTKFDVFGPCFFDSLVWFSGRCCLKFSHVFASCYDVIFDAEHCVFLYFFEFALCKINWKSEAKHFKNRTQNDQKINAKSYQKRLQNRSFFGPPLAMPGDLDFGPVLGSIWGPFWDHFGVKNRFESDWKNHQKNDWKKVMPRTPGTAENWPVVP